MKRTFLLLWGVTVTTVCQAAPLFDVTELGGLSDVHGAPVPTGINNSGTVVGYVSGPNFSQGWTWNGPGTTSGMPHGNGFIESSLSYDINESGQIVGMAVLNGVRFGYRYTPGTGYYFLSGMDNHPAYGLGMNDLGSVVGFSANADQVMGTRWNPGQPGEYLPAYNQGEEWSARDINNSGNSVGFSEQNGVRRAVMFRENGTIFDIHNGLPIGTISSEGEAINGTSKVVGAYKDADNMTQSFYVRGVGVHTISAGAGYSGSRLTGVNDLTTGVGYLIKEGSLTHEAAIWSEIDGIRNLNDLIDSNLGWHLDWARAINDNGWIVGSGTRNGVETGFLLKPVPEPASLVALVMGAGLLCRRRKAKN